MCCWPGAGLSTMGMSLPAFAYVAATASVLPRLRQSKVTGAFLDGANAAAVALMAYLGWQFARASLVHRPPFAISAMLAFRCRVESAWIIAGAAVAGAVLRVFHWA